MNNVENKRYSVDQSKKLAHFRWLLQLSQSYKLQLGRDNVKRETDHLFFERDAVMPYFQLSS